MKKSFFLFALPIAMIIGVLVLGLHQRKFGQGTVVLGDDVKVSVTVAASDTTRERGLSGRKMLAKNEGMLFLFDCSNRYAFWMKNMLFPLDILWIQDGILVDMTTDVPVPTPGEQLPLFSPQLPVNRVLEVPAGFAKAHGLRTGLAVAFYLDNEKEIK